MRGACSRASSRHRNRLQSTECSGQRIRRRRSRRAHNERFIRAPRRFRGPHRRRSRCHPHVRLRIRRPPCGPRGTGGTRTRAQLRGSAHLVALHSCTAECCIVQHGSMRSRARRDSRAGQTAESRRRRRPLAPCGGLRRRLLSLESRPSHWSLCSVSPRSGLRSARSRKNPYA